MPDPLTSSISNIVFTRMESIGLPLTGAIPDRTPVLCQTGQMSYAPGMKARHVVPGWSAQHALTGSVTVEIAASALPPETVGAIQHWERSVIADRLRVTPPSPASAGDTAYAGLLTLQTRDSVTTDNGNTTLRYAFTFEGGLFVRDAAAEITAEGYGTVLLPVPGAEDVPHG